MGLKGLQYILKKFESPVDLIKRAKKQGQQPLTLLADFFSFSFYVAETFVSPDPDNDMLLDVNPLKRYEFCELQKLRAIVWLFIEVLKRHNVSI